MPTYHAALADIPAFLPSPPANRAERLGIRVGRAVGTWLFSSNGHKDHRATFKEYPALRGLNGQTQPASAAAVLLDVSGEPPVLSLLRVGTETPVVQRLVQRALDDRYGTVLTTAVAIGALWTGLGADRRQSLVDTVRPLVAEAFRAFARLWLPLHIVDLLVSAVLIGVVLARYHRDATRQRGTALAS